MVVFGRIKVVHLFQFTLIIKREPECNFVLLYSWLLKHHRHNTSPLGLLLFWVRNVYFVLQTNNDTLFLLQGSFLRILVNIYCYLLNESGNCPYVSPKYCIPFISHKRNYFRMCLLT